MDHGPAVSHGVCGTLPWVCVVIVVDPLEDQRQDTVAVQVGFGQVHHFLRRVDGRFEERLIVLADDPFGAERRGQRAGAEVHHVEARHVG